MPGPPRADGGADTSGQLSRCTILPALTRVQGMLQGQGTVGTQIPSPAASQGPQPSVDVNARHRQPVLNLQAVLLHPRRRQVMCSVKGLSRLLLQAAPGDKTHSLPSRWNVNMIFTMNYIHCVIYIFNLNITYLFKYR